MAWDDEMVVMLRNLIGDTDTSPTYSDDRLAEQILVGASLLKTQITYSADYDISIDNLSIAPDPTDSSTRDQGFINIVSLYSALRLVIAEIREMARQSIAITDEGSKIDLKRPPQTLELMKKSYESQFNAALYRYQSGGVTSLGHIIVSPYSYMGEYSYGGRESY